MANYGLDPDTDVRAMVRDELGAICGTIERLENDLAQARETATKLEAKIAKYKAAEANLQSQLTVVEAALTSMGAVVMPRKVA